MRKRMTEYMSYMEKLLENEIDEKEYEIIKKDFMTQIQFFQNERLIHLMVTLAFAMIAIVSVVFNFYAQNLILGIFSLGVVGMLIPYLNHYFFLERGVQKMYTYYDKLIKLEGIDWLSVHK